MALFYGVVGCVIYGVIAALFIGLLVALFYGIIGRGIYWGMGYSLRNLRLPPFQNGQASGQHFASVEFPATLASTEF